ncbi:MAG: HAD hydrolase-like protein [Campylobacterota bacterium]|nr:HAD hydrolase-like protein [Campylobacterota bacterium]
MVGDSSKDMGVAENVGISSIFVTWGFSNEGKGDYIASHPSQILEIVR